MFEQFKIIYNRWLFKKYGFIQGKKFDQLPLVYRLFPLASPSLYSYWEGMQICDWFRQSLNKELRKDI